LWVAYWAACGLTVGAAMPRPGGAIVFLILVCGAYLGIVRLFAGYLVKKEISEHLKALETRY
jgi:hypothetical protein